MSAAAAAGTGGAGGVVSVAREDGLAIVTFDSPPLNLFNAAMSDGLDAAIAELEAERPRAVLFRAEGRVVSGGVDVSLFAALSGPREAEGVFAGLVAVARRVDRLPCPTVFAAHALCLTWAFELALACDLILASESASFGLVEKVIGLTPAMGGTQRLAERAGTGRAREFVMAGRPFGAAELERWNVVNRVLPDDGFDAAARACAGELAQGPTLAHAATKQVLRDYLEGGVELANERVPEVAGALFGSEDLQAAVRSFLDQGPGRATFRGR
ncbi:MAG TPA: enoyl-CoA hydratase/isomerase family protein [Solirubrobacteraceae bacterium]|jgi:enoyl-CoA hydratase/carnithine racemase|nr:enoyl-CoA hydratase/isomerase family protein [Solirubrobacteraceae bacterium]